MSVTNENRIVLSLLEIVERNSRVTQRSLADELGIAVGMVNAYVRRCVEKGFIKVRSIPLKRFAYYLTPRGFAEKSRLTIEYLTVSLEFFRLARAECSALLEDCRRNGWRRVVLIGSSDLAEIAVLSALHTQVEVLAVLDDAAADGSCAGHPVISLAAEVPAFDAILITDTRNPAQAVAMGLAMAQQAGLGEGRVVVPRLLGVSTTAAVPPEAAP